MLVVAAAAAHGAAVPGTNTPSQPALPAARSLMTGMIHPDGGGYRHYHVGRCNRSFTLGEVFAGFSAHLEEWTKMGEKSPWWSVDTAIDRGEGSALSEQKKLAFYRSGVDHVRAVQSDLANARGRRGPGRRRRPPGSLLDFGCGLGRLAFAFAHEWPQLRHVACVDQSAPHLATAEAEWMLRRGNRSAGSISFVRSTPDLLGALGGRRFDVVHSVLVMQHMVPPLQTIYLQQLCDALQPNGKGWIQIPTGESGCYLYRYRGRLGLGKIIGQEADPCDLSASVREGGMQMHYTPVADVRRALGSRGCAVLSAKDRGSAHTGGGSECRSHEFVFRKSPARARD